MVNGADLVKKIKEKKDASQEIKTIVKTIGEFVHSLRDDISYIVEVCIVTEGKSIGNALCEGWKSNVAT